MRCPQIVPVGTEYAKNNESESSEKLLLGFRPCPTSLLKGKNLKTGVAKEIDFPQDVVSISEICKKNTAKGLGTFPVYLIRSNFILSNNTAEANHAHQEAKRPIGLHQPQDP